MKIVQAVHSFPPSRGGVEHHAYHISKELCNLGNEVTVITSRDPGTATEEEMRGIKVKRLYSLDFSLFSSARYPVGSLLKMLKEDADVYAGHGYGSLMPLFASLAALIKGKPFVFTLHSYPEVKGRKRIFYHFYRFFIAPIFLNIAKKVIVVSKQEAKKLEKEVDSKKIVFIPNGIDAHFNARMDVSGKNRITYVGKLSEDKGIETLIRAFADVKKEYPGLVLNVVGRDDGMKKKLEKLASSLGIEAIFSEVPYKKMPYIYSESKAVVLPSKYEGFSLVWLEAMAAGRAIFSTPVGEALKLYEQVYDENAGSFLFSNQEELKEKLLAFLENPEKYQDIIRRAKYITKEEYSWGNVAAQTLNVYKEVI